MALQVLGKGLSALLEQEEVPLTAEETTSLHVKMVNPLQLRPGPYQPREYFNPEKLDELAESIKNNGMLQPILVRATERDGIYQIIAGERRWRACKQVGLAEVPVMIRPLSDQQALELALIENIQRQNLSPIEEAEGYKRLQVEFGYTQETIAASLGKSRSHIANLLRLLDLPEEVKQFLHKGSLSVGHARALITADNPVELAEKIVANGLSVREAEKFAKGYGSQNDSAKKSASTKPAVSSEKQEDIIALEQSLSKRLGLKIVITDKDGEGTVSIHFNNLAELDKIIQAIG